MANLGRDGLLELWAADRALAVERITSAGWGLKGQTLEGPGGMRIDLASCPAGWLNEPLLGEEIGLTWWSSFHWAPNGSDARSYLAWLGDDAEIDGRAIAINDAYFEAWNPSEQQTQELQRTQAQMNEEQIDLFAAQSFGVLGFAELEQSSSFRSLIGERCLLAFAVRSRRTPADSDPFLGPSPMLHQSVEVQAWLEFVERVAPGGSAAVLVMNNEWGLGFQSALEGATRPSHGEVAFRFVSHEPAAQTLGDEVAELFDSSPDVIFLATAGQPCVVAVKAIRALDDDVSIVVPNACTDTVPYINPLEDDAIGLGAAFSLVDQHVAPFRSTSFGQAVSQYSDVIGGQASLAWFETWYAVESLKIAAELPGGLTRTNVLLAMWSFDGHYPLVSETVDITWGSDQQLHDDAEILEFDRATGMWQLTLR